MESKFGVTLKSTGMGSPGNIRKNQNPSTKRTNATGLKPANVNNLKSMFDAGENAQDQVKVKGETSSKFSVNSNVNIRNKLSKDTDLGITGSAATSDQKPRQSFDKFDLDNCKFVIDIHGGEPEVAMAKVYTEKKPLQASIEKTRTQRQNSEEPVMDKYKAKSTLLENLSLLRTRPGSGGKKEDKSVFKPSSEATSDFSTASEVSTLTSESKTTSISKVTPKKYINSPRGWEGSTNTDKDVVSSSGKFSGAGNLSPKSSGVSQVKPIEFGLSFSKKADSNVGEKNTASHNRQSSSDSTGSFSPRSSIVSKTETSRYTSRQNSSGSDKHVGSSSSRSESPGSNVSTKLEYSVAKSHTNYQRQNSSPRLGRKIEEDTKPEWLDKSKQLVNKFQTKLTKPEQSDVTHSSVSRVEKSASSRTNFENRKLSNSSDGSVSSTKSLEMGTSYLKKTGGRERINKSQSLDTQEVLSKYRKQKFESRKMSTDQFQKIKGGFEQIGSGSTDKTVIKTADKPKPKFEIHTTKNFLERKHSFEMPKPESVSKNKTLKMLRETGKVPKVKEFVQALNSGRQRSASTGSLNNNIHESEDIYEAVDGENYSDVMCPDWPVTDSGTDSEAIYEFIPDPVDSEGRFDNNKDGQVKQRIPTRRLGQKRKGLSRPVTSLEEDEGILPDHSSSGFTTEGSSKEGTMESIDDRAGIDADVEYDSDSSNSGIYEPISPDFASRIRYDDDTGNDTPPELPADRPKKKKKDKEGKSTGQKIGSKLKQFYKSKITSSQEPPGLHKVSSAPAVTSSSASSGVFNKIGGKLKFIKRTKSSEPSAVVEEEIVISSSDYDASDNNDLEDSGPIMMNPPDDVEYIDSSSSSEFISTEGTDSHSSTYANEQRSGEGTAPPPPPLPPRISVNLSPGADGRTSPPLPPRNRISQNVNLDTVVPVNPGSVSSAHSTGDLRKGSWQLTASRDSYLHGHQIKSSSESNILGDFTPSESTTDGAPPVPPLPPKRGGITRDGSYVKADQFKQTEKNGTDSTRLREKETSDKRPVSSTYIGKNEVASIPERNNIIPPFDNMWKFKGQFDDDDDIYIDLNNEDDLYGQLDRRYTTKFESEPLYQIYNKDKLSRASHKHAVVTNSDEESGDERGDERIYEAVDEMMNNVKAGLEDDTKTTSPSKTVSTLELFGKTGSVLRALWSEMPEVKESGILNSIAPQERKIQEAMFEIITSEASYLKSINVLINVFLMSQEFSSEHSDRCVTSRQERHVLFSNIGAVREASEHFLMDLEARWQQSIQLSDVCDIIYKHASNKFDCYIRYCSNQTFQDRATQELMTKQEFADAVRRLERSPECQGLPMISFLLLPMQRITRLPLLVDAICHRLEPGTNRHKSATRALDALNRRITRLPLLVDAICHRLEPGTNRHKSATRALDALNRVVRKCNDGAKKMQQTEQMCLLVQNLEFKVKEVPLISASRHLVKQGELTRIVSDTSSKIPFGRAKSSKQNVHIYLFNDLILFSKKKSSNQYVVIDYAARNALHVEVIETTEAKARHLPQGVPSGCKNLFLVAMLENHEQKQVEMILSCKSPSDRARWVDALTPVTKIEDNEKIYEEWDCPQVHCIKKYTAAEPDELMLEEGDVVNVFKKMADGWYEGERIRDGERGWFPSEHTEEIVNSHVRAKNLRLRYRLLLASQDYADTYSKA